MNESQVWIHSGEACDGIPILYSFSRVERSEDCPTARAACAFSGWNVAGRGKPSSWFTRGSGRRTNQDSRMVARAAKGTGCKPVGFGLRWFESTTIH